MSETCKVCGSSETREPHSPSESSYTSPPHLKPFIGTNISPSHIQESQFREMLRESMESRRDLDERIATMRRDLEKLVRQRARKERELEEYKSVLHPIRFGGQCQCQLAKADIDDMDLTASFCLLALHRVILSENVVDRAQLHRAASHELSISIFSKVHILRSHLLLEMLFATSSRWKELAIYITIKSLESFSPLRGSLPSMTTLHVWAHDESVVPATLSMFEFAPKLTKLIGHPRVLCKLILPFSQIVEYGQDRDLDIHVYRSIDELQHLLRRSQCPLETLSLYLYMVPDDACVALLKDIPTLTLIHLEMFRMIWPTNSWRLSAKAQQSSLRCDSSNWRIPASFDSVQIEQLKASRPALSVIEIEDERY
ncbi:hypothetical protein C8J56DRAFT_1054813 [Mycena floridula]|nr:hypothetical protein C8J56DRAFT_1054813 [Mycena floridula]